MLALSILIAGYLLFTAGGNLLESHRLAANEDQLRVQVDALHVQETQLEQVRDYLRSDAYIEFMARRVFGFVKPGESLVIVQAREKSLSLLRDVIQRLPFATADFHKL